MRVAVVLYDRIEPIELAVIGTLSMARRVSEAVSFFTVSQSGGMVTLQNGLRVDTDHAFTDAPEADVVIVTGGPGWRDQVENPAMLQFLRLRHAAGQRIASVCTGALIVAAAGLLAGKTATTKVPVTGAEQCPVTTLGNRHPDVQAIPALIVDEGDVITGGGVTLGIDLTLYLIGSYLGEQTRQETARIMEYQAAAQANQDRLPTVRGHSMLGSGVAPASAGTVDA